MPNRIFRIESDTKSVEELEETTFAGNGFLETEDVHEWLISHPGILGEDLLVIQREHVNVSGSLRRPDIIAVDRDGNLVIVEVKRDDSGMDIYWQAALYAASYWPRTASEIVEMYATYASTDVDEARSNLAAHVGAEDTTGLEAELNRHQRIILVARTFPKEVTTTVLWLNDQGGLDVSCLQLTPHFDSASKSYFLQSSYIIPVPETKELMVEVRRTQQQRAQSGVEIDARQNDDVTNFMFSISESANNELSEDLKLTKRSRWAGKGTRGPIPYRYFNMWYEEEPWHRYNFFFTVHWVGEEDDSNFGDADVQFWARRTHLISYESSEHQFPEKIEKLCRSVDGERGFKFVESRRDIYLSKRISSISIASHDIEEIVAELAWLVGKLVPQINMLFGSSDDLTNTSESLPQD